MKFAKKKNIVPITFYLGYEEPLWNESNCVFIIPEILLFQRNYSEKVSGAYRTIVLSKWKLYVNQSESLSDIAILFLRFSYNILREFYYFVFIISR